MKEPLKNIAASVHHRLLNLAKETNRPFSELVQYYALERWLYRLSKSDYSDRFVLKGALMLLVWKTSLSRPTRDIDLLGQISNDLESIRKTVAEVCQAVVPDDGIVFDPASVVTERISEDADYKGVRARFRGLLGNTRLPMQIDIGFSDVVTPAPIQISYPSILGHPAPELLGYNRETIIAEKFEAMMKLGDLNSRMKDFFDIVLLANSGCFNGRLLANAIKETFHRRGSTVEMDPVCFTSEFARNPEKQKQWTAFLRRSLIATKVEDFSSAVEQVRAFLQPVATALLQGKPFDKEWIAGGPWKP